MHVLAHVHHMLSDKHVHVHVQCAYACMKTTQRVHAHSHFLEKSIEKLK